eukprot:CAMPEP_0201592478 /NCGR_PEP_ID=MMETSP0190_2-20130828/190361_1 /ASSEMBLY_ACC=CAM_ASM_000263 /TAXON_ID=37353 /ORGANISM="Rosalina sp." /LENGTH=643 /DNA_ID=CAMNT_0048051271 /DNA_START=158 /DNA_END=2093 /DNA_ORIENTATION=+
MKDVMEQYVHTIHIVVKVHGIGYVQIQLLKNVKVQHRHLVQLHVVNVLNHQIQQIVMKNVILIFVHMIHIVAIGHGIGFVLMPQKLNVKLLEVILKEKNLNLLKAVMKHVVIVQNQKKVQIVQLTQHVIQLMSIDSYCCDWSWDNICANGAQNICNSNDYWSWPEEEETGSCCDCTEESYGTGCNEVCDNEVCPLDNYCCDGQWDSICANGAENICQGYDYYGASDDSWNYDWNSYSYEPYSWDYGFDSNWGPYTFEDSYGYPEYEPYESPAPWNYQPEPYASPAPWNYQPYGSSPPSYQSYESPAPWNYQPYESSPPSYQSGPYESPAPWNYQPYESPAPWNYQSEPYYPPAKQRKARVAKREGARSRRAIAQKRRERAQGRKMKEVEDQVSDQENRFNNYQSEPYDYYDSFDYDYDYDEEENDDCFWSVCGDVISACASSPDCYSGFMAAEAECEGDQYESLEHCVEQLVQGPNEPIIQFCNGNETAAGDLQAVGQCFLNIDESGACNEAELKKLKFKSFVKAMKKVKESQKSGKSKKSRLTKKQKASRKDRSKKARTRSGKMKRRPRLEKIKITKKQKASRKDRSKKARARSGKMKRRPRLEENKDLKEKFDHKDHKEELDQMQEEHWHKDKEDLVYHEE